MATRITLLALALLGGLLGLPANAAERVKVRNLSGKWVLNAEKPGSAKAEVTTMIIEHDSNMIRWTVMVNGSDGSRLTQSYGGALNGEAHPMFQNGMKMAEIAYIALGPSTIESVSTLPDGKKSRATHTVSEDGKTITTRGASGTVSVWHKQ